MTEKIEGKITEKILKSSIVEEEISKPIYGPKTKKHLLQASSLVGLLDDYELLKSDICYVELGAGKGKFNFNTLNFSLNLIRCDFSGQLSYWIYKSVEHLGRPSLLLVDRSSQRHKFDNKLDKIDGCIQRIRIDIADFVLYKVDLVESSKCFVGVSKHLCGEATGTVFMYRVGH